MDDTNEQPALKPPKNPGALWAWLRVGFALIATGGVISIAHHAYELSSGGVLPQDDYSLGYAAYVLSALLLAAFALSGLVLMLVFLPWLTYRMNANLHRLGVDADIELMAPGWAAVWYLIPIANLIMPIRVINQIWRGTFTRADESGKESLAGPGWVLGIISSALGNWSARIAGDAATDPTLPTPQASSITGLLSDFTLLGFCMLMWLTIGQLARTQREIIAAR